MKEELVEILCCPMCKGDLNLKVSRKEGAEILEGEFTCPKCNVKYPVQDGIPNMLPPEVK